MSNFPDEDKKLVEFVRKYQPTAPTGQKDMETRLMKSVAQHPPRQSREKYRQLFWLVPSVVAAVGLVFWLGKPRVTPSLSIASDTQDLETFMVNSWEYSLGDNPENTAEYTSFDEMLLNPSETEQPASQP